MHQLHQLIKKVNSTHPRLGPLVGINLLSAKAKRCILNVAPAGCGKSAATDIVHNLLKTNSQKYTALTLAGLHRIHEELTGFNGHIIVDDLGAEKSIWSRVSTITVLATLTHTHYVKKITASYILEIADFNGSACLNIQPVLLNSLIHEDDWISVVRDKVIRYYHMVRPIKPKATYPDVTIEWGVPLNKVAQPKLRGRLWYQLVAIGLTQWSYARCLEHIPMLLRACAALDGREKVNTSDLRLLIKLLKPMQLERYIMATYDFESGRFFLNNIYCILVEIVSHGEPTVGTIAEDYKVSPETVERLVQTAPQWCWTKSNSPKRILPTEQAKKILDLVGAWQKW